MTNMFPSYSTARVKSYWNWILLLARSHTVYRGDYRPPVQCYSALPSTSRARLCSPASENPKYKIKLFSSFSFPFNLQPGAAPAAGRSAGRADTGYPAHSPPGTAGWLSTARLPFIYSILTPFQALGTVLCSLHSACRVQGTTRAGKCKVKAVS